VLPSEF
jgi:hypothetical protein